MTYRLEARDITKSFGALRANDGVTLRVERASVHAVLGENGAGKSTLMNILYGLYQPDSGEIRVDGLAVRIDGPRAALALGIGMVHQHFMLVDPLTVTENVVLGHAGGGLGLDLQRHATRLLALSETYGFAIDPHSAVWRLPIGMQQRVEILKMLYHDADILILDEPTSVLTPGEVGPFMDSLSRLRASGKTILFITHKLEEVLQLADRVSVMRRGRIVAECAGAEASRAELARLMIGREIAPIARGMDMGVLGDVVLDVDHLSALGARGERALDDLSLHLRAGEILGIAGVDGNGQSELAEVIVGLRAPTAGVVRFAGRDIAAFGIAARRHRLGIGYVPEDRGRTGLVMDHSVAENVMLRDYRRAPHARLGILDFAAIQERARDRVERYDVRLQSVHQSARSLSGGNQQKIILAREIEANPRLLVVAQPTKGLDVGATAFVQETLLAARARGTAVLYISTELEHLLAVADRVAVMYRGRIAGELAPAEATAERLGLLMAGAA